MLLFSSKPLPVRVIPFQGSKDFGDADISGAKPGRTDSNFILFKAAPKAAYVSHTLSAQATPDYPVLKLK
ncbi:hypothetical protein [Arcticibacter tournemirensis]|uniref:Uncharacterized protein n=1 Tax=Arcticibacter tournemirensis TaxID=699437 RepID=A0A4Q0MBB3_9SPHI|nr:hypothetical protein [Arcticibacter tournemirensis]RXF70581.1 hypothetical protein EKH83_08040 [Arcticibacter tournemirensis]